VAAGVVILGCPDYKALMTLRAGMEHGDKRLPQGFHDIVAKLDPRLENVSKKDLLILKGEIDELVPWSACQGFVSHLPPETTELVGFPDVGHAFPREMMEKSVDWIVEWRRRR
jgi:predicted esterase